MRLQAVRVLDGAVGVFDAASAVLGCRFGRSRWPGTKRTLEGTVLGLICALFFALATLTTFAVVYEVDGSGSVFYYQRELRAATIALTCGAAVEAFTFDVDNILLPLVTTAVFCCVL